MNTNTKLIRRQAGDSSQGFDSLFEDFFYPLRRFQNETGSALTPAMDVVENDDNYQVKVELPGIKKEDINITLQEGVLTVNASTRHEEAEEDEAGRTIRRELRRGEFVRSLNFGQAIEAGEIDAQLFDGVLNITLPRAREAKPKRIEVKG